MVTAYTRESAESANSQEAVSSIGLRLGQEDMFSIQAYNSASAFGIDSSSSSIFAALDTGIAEAVEKLLAALHHLTLNINLQAVYEPHAIGLRPLVLTESDVDALQQHLAHPTATPKIPLRAVL